MSFLKYFLVLWLAVATPPSTAPTLKQKTGDSDAGKGSPETILPSQPHPKQDIQAALVSTFSRFVGIKEEPLGSNNGTWVNIFNRSCGLEPSEHAPWCASVANYGYLQVGLSGHGAYSPSWFSKSRVVSLHDVKQGDMALVFFPSKGRYAHTIACIEKVVYSVGRAVEVTTLEGNTNAQGSREGDQFARRRRPADTLTFVRWWKN